jgi:tetratricopeptide (TPR) repeat protein
LKPKRHIQKRTRSSDGNNTQNSTPTISRRRLWLFRIAVAPLLSLFVFGAIELGLRIFGYGYPTSFFLRTKIDGVEYYVPNDCFGFRFFPPYLARTPVPQRVPVKKPANTYRIFLFGESAAQGDPDPTFGAGRYLQVQLRERYPGTDFEVVCVAMTAINSHVILPIARECARLDGDLWIIYMGNNEMIGPFGASTVFGSRVPATGFVRANLAVKRTRTGQWLEHVVQHWHPNSASPKTWEGLNMFKDRPLLYDDANRLRAYGNFKKNLADILRAGQGAGVPIILSTVGSNLKDCAPFGSAHPASLDQSRKRDWEQLFQQGIASETNGDFSNALEAFQKAAAIDPHYAELQFRMGECDLALTNDTKALREYELARDDDTLAFRADTTINHILEDVATARAAAGVHFLDATEMLAENSPNGIPGNELFYEHVHLNFAGNYLLGRAFAEQTAKLLPESIRAHARGEWASAELCDRRLAATLWDRSRVWQENFSRVSMPPFTGQLNDVPRARFYMSKLKQMSAQMNDRTRAESRMMYETAVEAAPDDYALHQNFAQFLSQTGELPKAIQEEKRCGELLPQTPEAPFKAGALLVREGDTSEAEKRFSQALGIRKDYVPALNELGLIYANRQRTTEASNYFARALAINPGYPEAYLSWGFTDQCSGNLNQAEARYQQAAALQPAGPAAYFSQAVALATQHRRAESMNSFQAAVYMNPQFWQARYLLGMELAGENKLDEAQAQFAAVTHLRPDFDRAHLNYAVALAKTGKLEEAQKEFQTTLKLNPTNSIAQKNLEAVQANIAALKLRGENAK